MELYTWYFLIQLVMPNGQVQDHNTVAESKEQCLAWASEILDHKPEEFKAVSIGVACIKEKSTDNPA